MRMPGHLFHHLVIVRRGLQAATAGELADGAAVHLLPRRLVLDLRRRIGLPARRDLSLAHAAAVQALLDRAGMTATDIAWLGFHGHTLLHRPHERRTWQTGDGALLSKLTGISTVSDFRSQDVAMGGQGAPLVPLYHLALARYAQLGAPLLVLNLGGVGNVTYIGSESEHDLIAFDTGPGNALIDDWMLRHANAAHDESGKTAAAGAANADRLARLLDHPYFNARPPKSLDRNDFSAAAVEGLSVEDGAATLARFTAECVARAKRHFAASPARWVACGGGRRNDYLLQTLRNVLGERVDRAEELGWDGDAMEAQAFAYLAVRHLAGLPLSFPSTTGVPRPMPGGVLFRP